MQNKNSHHHHPHHHHHPLMLKKFNRNLLCHSTHPPTLKMYFIFTYYYFIIAASLFNTALERLAPNRQPTTVLHYHTVLIKELFSGDKQYIPVLNKELCSMAIQIIHSMDQNNSTTQQLMIISGMWQKNPHLKGENPMNNVGLETQICAVATALIDYEQPLTSNT